MATGSLICESLAGTCLHLGELETSEPIECAGPNDEALIGLGAECEHVEDVRIDPPASVHGTATKRSYRAGSHIAGLGC